VTPETGPVLTLGGMISITFVTDYKVMVHVKYQSFKKFKPFGIMVLKKIGKTSLS
jgi:hypothetical protein